MSDDYGDVDVEDNYVDDLRDERDALAAQLAKARGLVAKFDGAKDSDEELAIIHGLEAWATSLDTPSPTAPAAPGKCEGCDKPALASWGARWCQDCGIKHTCYLGCAGGPCYPDCDRTSPAGPTPGIRAHVPAGPMPWDKFIGGAPDLPEPGPGIPIARTAREVAHASRGIPMGLDPVALEAAARECEATCSPRDDLPTVVEAARRIRALAPAPLAETGGDK